MRCEQPQRDAQPLLSILVHTLRRMRLLLLLVASWLLLFRCQASVQAPCCIACCSAAPRATVQQGKCEQARVWALPGRTPPQHVRADAAASAAIPASRTLPEAVLEAPGQVLQVAHAACACGLAADGLHAPLICRAYKDAGVHVASGCPGCAQQNPDSPRYSADRKVVAHAAYLAALAVQQSRDAHRMAQAAQPMTAAVSAVLEGIEVRLTSPNPRGGIPARRAGRLLNVIRAPATAPAQRVGLVAALTYDRQITRSAAGSQCAPVARRASSRTHQTSPFPCQPCPSCDARATHPVTGNKRG